MSEYQYYEFQTVDRRLTEREMQDLRGYSTRAHITPTSFTNEYSFGSFKGDADASAAGNPDFELVRDAEPLTALGAEQIAG